MKKMFTVVEMFCMNWDSSYVCTYIHLNGSMDVNFILFL